MIKIPPALPATPATDQAVRDLIESCKPLAMFILTMPESGERELAAVALNNALLWTHQAILRATQGAGLIVAPGPERH